MQVKTIPTKPRDGSEPRFRFVIEEEDGTNRAVTPPAVSWDTELDARRAGEAVLNARSSDWTDAGYARGKDDGDREGYNRGRRAGVFYGILGGAVMMALGFVLGAYHFQGILG